MKDDEDISHLFTNKGIRMILRSKFQMGLLYLKIKKKYPKEFKLLKKEIDKEEIMSLKWKFPITYFKNKNLEAFKIKNSKKPTITDFEFRKN